MNNIEEYFHKELEIDFYGFTVEDVVTEVKCALENVVNAALEDGKKKVILKFGSKNAEAFQEVRKNYLAAINNHKYEMKELIRGAFKLPCSENTLNNGTQVDESSLDREINDLQMRSAALDAYMKKLLKADVKLQAVQTDISELESNFEGLDIAVSQLLDNFHLGAELLS